MLGPDQDEARRRVRAAFAYAGLSQAKAQEKLAASRSSVARLTGKKGKETKPLTWEDLWNVADACGLPREFFGADLSRLDQIVSDDVPRPAKRSVGDALLVPPGGLGRIAEGSQTIERDLPQVPPKTGEGSG